MAVAVSTQTPWEYRIVRVEMMDFDEDEFKAMEATLNRFGMVGWEVVSVLKHVTTDQNNMPFLPVLVKRPKQD